MTAEQLNDLLALGRLNGVEGKLAQLYPAQLAAVLVQVRAATYLYSRVLREAGMRLQKAGIPAVFIEEGLSGFRSRGNIDLVIPRQFWRQIVRILPDVDSIWIEEVGRLVFQPPAGPSVYIHPDLSWLGVNFVTTRQLVAHAVRTRNGILVPSRVDYLRILLGHALFQQHDLDLSQLLVLWGLMRRPAVIMAARAEADREGWLSRFEDMLALAGESINRMHQRQEIELPVQVPAFQPRAADRRIRMTGAF